MKKGMIRHLVIVCLLFLLLPIGFISVTAQIKALSVVIAYVAIPFSLLTFYTILYLKKRLIRPLNSLVEAAKIIASGDLAHKIDHATNDELGEFTLAFDQMRETLYQRQKQQELFEEERKQFIDNISHDLKTPLASISAYIEALQDGLVSEAEEQQHYFKIIENKITVLTELSKQLSLSYETPETLSVCMQPVPCYAWTLDFFEDLKSRVPSKRSLL